MSIWNNTSNVHKSFTGTTAGSTDVGSTPNWQKTSGHIPGTTPSVPSPVSNFKIDGTVKNYKGFGNPLGEVYNH